MRNILCHILLFLTATGVNAQKFEAELQNDTMLIGQHNIIALKLKDKKINIPKNFKFPGFKDEIIPKVEVLNTSKPVEKKLNKTDSVLYEVQYKIIVFDTGYYAIPPFEAQWNDTIKKTNPILLTVNTVAVDTSKAIKDIKGIYKVQYTLADRWEAFQNWLKQHWVILSVSGVAAITIAILLFLLIRNRKNRVEIVVKRPAHELAFERLQRLEEKKLLQESKDKAYYTELTIILRKYLEERYSVRAMEQTTTEIKHAFKWVDISKAQKQEMITLLQLADLVKFAKEKPVNSDNESSINRVRKFIKDTKLDEAKNNNTEGQS